MKNILGRRTKSPLVRRPILFNTCVNIPMSSQLLAVYCPRKIHILRLPGTPDGLKDRPLFTEQGRGGRCCPYLRDSEGHPYSGGLSPHRYHSPAEFPLRCGQRSSTGKSSCPEHPPRQKKSHSSFFYRRKSEKNPGYGWARMVQVILWISSF